MTIEENYLGNNSFRFCTINFISCIKGEPSQNITLLPCDLVFIGSSWGNSLSTHLSM